MRSTKNKKGFTLIELMIVVAIVAILAAIALPAYQDYIARSQLTEGLNLAGGLKLDVAEFYENTGAHCGSNTECSAPVATDIKGKYVSQVEVIAGGIIVASMKTAGISKCAQGKTISLIPNSPGDNLPVAWGCDSTSVCKPSSCTLLVP
jgi:type IV pilus assembly protein PilA